MPIAMLGKALIILIIVVIVALLLEANIGLFGGPRGGNQTNGTDLIVTNLSIERNGEFAMLTPYIRNIGAADAGPSTTRLLVISSGMAWMLNTSAIRARQTIAAEPAVFAVSSGFSEAFNTTADFFNRVPETNENNNNLATSAVFP